MAATAATAVMAEPVHLAELELMAEPQVDRAQAAPMAVPGEMAEPGLLVEPEVKAEMAARAGRDAADKTSKWPTGSSINPHEFVFVVHYFWGVSWLRRSKFSLFGRSLIIAHSVRER